MTFMHIALHQVSKTFVERRASLAALSPLTLEIPSGSFVALIGPSGCGKSTLLRLIADQLRPTSGAVQLDGAPPAQARRSKAIGWMAQSPALLPWATVLDNVRLPRHLNPAQQRPAPTPEALLEMMELSAFAGAYPHTLSGGMQQRVALARTLAIGAPLWLMDEPFAALDELTRETLTEELLTLWTHFGPTVLWVTHNIPEAARLADRVIVFTARPGRISAIVEVPLPHPRDATAPEVVAVIRELRQHLRA
ncbi:MAG TPA: ABC transporter ATP-binding protein [Chloroflexi bacterium]|nr:ABC transporter ATP-binding protein [Chloroflexota bacterium]